MLFWISANLLVEIHDGAKGRDLAVGLTVEDAIYRGLRGADLGGNPRLAPGRSALDFPEQGCDVFVHGGQHIHEWIDVQYPNE